MLVGIRGGGFWRGNGLVREYLSQGVNNDACLRSSDAYFLLNCLF